MKLFLIDTEQAFFCAFSQKLKAKKTQALEKTQGFSDTKLNVPVVWYNLFLQKLKFWDESSRFLLESREKLTFEAKTECKKCKLSVFFQVFWIFAKVANGFHQNSKFLPKIWYFCSKNSIILPKNSRKLLKNSMVRWFLPLAPTGNPHKKKPVITSWWRIWL